MLENNFELIKVIEPPSKEKILLQELIKNMETEVECGIPSEILDDLLKQDHNKSQSEIDKENRMLSGKDDLRQYSSIKVSERAPSEVRDHFNKYNSIIYLGEIPNMRGHGVFVCFYGTLKNTIEFGYHIGDFEELSEEEV